MRESKEAKKCMEGFSYVLLLFFSRKSGQFSIVYIRENVLTR